MSFIHGRVGTLTVNGEATPVYVNLNTCAYFDSHSKRRLLSIFNRALGLMNIVVNKLAEATREAAKEGAPAGSEEIALKDLNLNLDNLLEDLDFPTVLLISAAALHKYNASDEPVYLFTPGQLGGYLGGADMVKLLPMLKQGAQDFLARQQDLPKSLQNTEDEDAPDPTKARTPPSDGGTGSSDLDAAILDSLESSSDAKPSGDSSSDGKPENSPSSEKTSEPAASTP